MQFIETPRFPASISYGSRGGPRYKTTISESHSGKEQRNVNWSLPRHEYDASFAVKTQEELYIVTNFFHISQGMAYGFRYKDWLDYKSGSPDSEVRSTDVQIAIGDGSTKSFQLKKFYVVGTYGRERVITKPVPGTVVISLNGASSSSGWTVNTSTGVITFATAPANDTVIGAGFEFDVPVRFDIDMLPMRIEDFDSVGATIPLLELK